jgi:hypothetical protein
MEIDKNYLKHEKKIYKNAINFAEEFTAVKQELRKSTAKLVDNFRSKNFGIRNACFLEIPSPATRLIVQAKLISNYSNSDFQ